MPGGETEQLHPVATDQPGLILHRPYQKLRQIAVIYALLPLLCAGIGAWIATQVAYTRAERHTDARIETLERDLAQRRAARAAQDAARDEQTRELLKLVCDLLDHATPRDETIEADRALYGCAGNPASLPPSVTSSSVAPPRTARTTAGAPQPPAVRTTAVRPLQPSPAGPPPTTGMPAPGPLLCVDLPVLPPVCL
ncbi:hypothetical protein [Dactylosporangium salmoneum]